MNSIEVDAKSQTFEWEIKFREGTTWVVQEANGTVIEATSDCNGPIHCEGMDTLTFLRRALFSGASIISVRPWDTSPL